MSMARLQAVLLLSAAWLAAAPAAADPAAAEDPAAERRADWITAGTVGLVGAYGAIAWWSGDLSTKFRVRREGWFSQDTDAGGADKLGHGFSTYLGTRLLVRAYQEVGLGAERSIERAAVVSLATLMGVEVLDGFSKRFRFSPEDAAMNLSGVGLAWLLETHPELDRKLDFRVLYRRSNEARATGIHDPIEDYSGQTYLLAVKGAGFDALAKVPAARYLELVMGYGTRGYRPGLAGVEPSRHFYAGVGVNLAELLDLAVFEARQPRSRTQRVTHGILEYLQVPGTVALHDDQL